MWYQLRHGLWVFVPVRQVRLERCEGRHGAVVQQGACKQAGMELGVVDGQEHV